MSPPAAAAGPAGGPSGQDRTAVLLAVVALAVCLAPLGGQAAWARFVLASALAGSAAALHRDGLALGATALLGVIAVKDGLLVVPEAFAGVFHVVLAGVTGAALYRGVRDRTSGRVRPEPLEVALALLPVAGLWSLQASQAPGATVAGTARLMMLLVAALVVGRSLGTREALRRALAVFVLSAVALAGVAIVQKVFPSAGLGLHPALGVLEHSRPTGFYMDPNFLAAHLVLAATGALWLAADGRSWRWGAAGVVLLGVVALTLSRSAWVAGAAGVGLSLVTGPRRVRVAVAGVLAAALVLGALLVGPGELAGRAVSAFDPGGGNVTRIAMMRSSLAMAADHPVAGVGLEAFEVAYPAYRLPGTEAEVAHPHQVPLALVAQTGIAGAIALVALLLAGFATARRALRSGGPAGGAAVAGLAALGTGAWFQYFLYFEVAWLIAGLVIAASRLPAEEAS